MGNSIPTKGSAHQEFGMALEADQRRQVQATKHSKKMKGQCAATYTSV
jgi:hypothetical protein